MRPSRRQGFINKRPKALEITQMYPTFFSKVNPKIRLPNETVFEILEHVPGRSVVNAMCASKSMHIMGARVLYTVVDVEGPPARLFCTTIASRTGLSAMYASFTRNFSFRSTSRFDKFISFPVFCETLLCLQNLRQLSLCIAPGDGEFMHACLLRYGITRSYVPGFETPRSNDAQISYPYTSLPLLDTLRVGGDTALLGIAKFRNLTDLTVTSTLSMEEVDDVLHILQNLTCATTLTSLAIRLHQDVDLVGVMQSIAWSAKSLRTLTIEKYPIDPIAVLASMEQIFPTLRTLLLNRFARRGPCSTPRGMSVDDFNSIVKRKLEKITESKHYLSFVCFGPTLWARHFDDRSWSTDIDAAIRRWWVEGGGAIQKRELQYDSRPIFRGTPWKGG